MIADAAKIYPEAWAYLQTPAGQKLCITEDESQTMSKATWATLADGTKVGWDGIGGVPYYAFNSATGVLRLPDLRGMYAESAGFDSLGVGEVHGDAIREIKAKVHSRREIFYDPEGAFTAYGTYVGPTAGDTQSGYYNTLDFSSSRVVPTAAKNQPRAFGTLACVYLGRPK